MIEDEARPGRPFSVRNEGLIVKVRERIQEERCATVRMMADEFGVNRETIRQILVEDLGKRKVALYLNLIERTNKMQPCSRIYYSNVS